MLDGLRRVDTSSSFREVAPGVSGRVIPSALTQILNVDKALGWPRIVAELPCAVYYIAPSARLRMLFDNSNYNPPSWLR